MQYPLSVHWVSEASFRAGLLPRINFSLSAIPTFTRWRLEDVTLMRVLSCVYPPQNFVEGSVDATM